jgi:hypothetical protein
VSHLTTLIQRVKKCEFAGCGEEDGCGAGEYIQQALKEKLLNLAEYMTYSHDFDQRESLEATELLWAHGMEGLICNPEAITGFLDRMYPDRVAQRTTQGGNAPMMPQPMGVKA